MPVTVPTTNVDDKEVVLEVRSSVPCPKPQVGLSVAPLGPATTQERFTTPVKPPEEATVMVDVPLEPAATVIAPLLLSEIAGLPVLPVKTAWMFKVWMNW